MAVTRRCELPKIAAFKTVYYRPTGISAEDLALMRRLDEIHLARPFYGSRRLRDELETQGHPVNRKRVQRSKPRTSQPAVGHTVYPYLLRGLSIERPNQVWATDICYIPMAHGFMYLVAIMDWYSRRVLAWRVSNPSTVTSVSRPSRTRWRTAGIFNTDQGAQFTSQAKTHAVGRQCIRRAALAQRQIRGVYAYDTPVVRAGLTGYFQFYNGRRRHSSLGRQDVVYFATGFGTAA